MTLPILLLLLLPTRDTLPAATALHHALDSLYDARLEAALAELRFREKSRWLRFLPSFGLTYTAGGQARPAIGYSSSLLYQSLQDRQLRRARISSLTAKAGMERQLAHERLDALLMDFQAMEEELRRLEQIGELDSRLYELAALDYEAARMPPSQFLPKKREYLQRRLQLLLKQQEWQRLRREIITLSFDR